MRDLISDFNSMKAIPKNAKFSDYNSNSNDGNSNSIPIPPGLGKGNSNSIPIPELDLEIGISKKIKFRSGIDPESAAMCIAQN